MLRPIHSPGLRSCFRSWLLVLCLSLSATVVPRAVERVMQPYPQGDATVQSSGVVADATESLLANITVYAYQDPTGTGDWKWVNYPYIDTAGAYTISGLSAGVYPFEFYSNSYYGEFYDDVATVGTATDIIVAPGAAVSNRNAQLAQKGRIRGRVTDQRGGPLQLIGVNAHYDPNDSGVWSLAAFASTDSNGAYALEGLERGNYRIEFLGREGRLTSEFYQNAPTLETATTLKVQDNTIENIDAQLAGATGRIGGLVTNENNEPLAEADIKIYQDADQNGAWEWLDSAVTDANGGYVVAALWDGAYRVEFSDSVFQYKNCPFLRYAIQYYTNVDNLAAATNVVIQGGNPVANINARLAVAGQIQGRVTDLDNHPIAGLWVVALNNQTGGMPCFSSPTAADGLYMVGAADGLYRIFFNTRRGFFDISHTWEYYDNVASVEAATDISVVTRTIITGIDAQLAPAGTIRGVVTDLNGARLPQIKVTAYDDTDGDGQWQLFAITQTDAAGAYAIPGVGNDTFNPVAYRVSFADLRTPPQYHAKVYVDAGYLENGQDILALGNHEIGEINIQLVPFDAMNLAPLAHDDTILLFQEEGRDQWYSVGSVLANDRDAEAEPLTALLVDLPRQGAVTLNIDGAVTYTPTNSIWISDTFTYRAQDQRQASNLATATIVPVINSFFLPVFRR